MKRASKTIALVLITSASILQGCDEPSSSQDTSSGDWPADSRLLDDSQYYTSTQPTTQSSPYYGHSQPYSRGYNGSHSSYWYTSPSRSYGGSNGGFSNRSGTGNSSGASHSTGTSRGGFGSTGHAASGGGT